MLAGERAYVSSMDCRSDTTATAKPGSAQLRPGFRPPPGLAHPSTLMQPFGDTAAVSSSTAWHRRGGLCDRPSPLSSSSEESGDDGFDTGSESESEGEGEGEGDGEEVCLQSVFHAAADKNRKLSADASRPVLKTLLQRLFWAHVKTSVETAQAAAAAATAATAATASQQKPSRHRRHRRRRRASSSSRANGNHRHQRGGHHLGPIGSPRPGTSNNTNHHHTAAAASDANAPLKRRGQSGACHGGDLSAARQQPYPCSKKTPVAPALSNSPKPSPTPPLPPASSRFDVAAAAACAQQYFQQPRSHAQGTGWSGADMSQLVQHFAAPTWLPNCIMIGAVGSGYLLNNNNSNSNDLSAAADATTTMVTTPTTTTTPQQHEWHPSANAKPFQHQSLVAAR